MTKNILLCDDEIHILRAAEFKLKRAGFVVRLAQNGEEALEKIAEEMPDLVLTDNQMPVMGGLGLCQRLRANPETRDLPVLMLTAKGFEVDAAELAENYGIREVLSKPFSPRELLQIVQRHLGVTEPAECGAVSPPA